MKNLFDLKGKVALVTGASSGLGVQFAKALANQGADVAIAARRVDRLEQVKKEIEAIGVRCIAVPCDVLVPEQITAMVNTVKKEFGRIDILVNNAGVGKGIPAPPRPTRSGSPPRASISMECIMLPVRSAR